MKFREREDKRDGWTSDGRDRRGQEKERESDGKRRRRRKRGIGRNKG